MMVVVITHVPLGGVASPAPLFFTSISGVKSNFAPVALLELLVARRAPTILVSAYDVADAAPDTRARMRELMAQAKTNGTLVLLDSGKYESYWLRTDGEWTEERFFEVLAATPTPVAFAFDNAAPSDDLEFATAEVRGAVLRAEAHGPTCSICPIVHGSPDTLPERVARVAADREPLLVAVPERELGDGILARAATTRAIRRALDTVAPASALHLLGTGNPLALLLLSMMGANSFDGLEWCQTCVDPDRAHLHHAQHRDFVRSIGAPLSSPIPYGMATLLHNLEFYDGWMTRIRQALKTGTAMDLLASYLPPTEADRVLQTVSDLLT